MKQELFNNAHIFGIETSPVYAVTGLIMESTSLKCLLFESAITLNITFSEVIM